MDITIDISTVLTRIYAESAWYAAYSSDIPALTPDNEHMLTLTIEAGLADIKARLSQYVVRSNFNPRLDTGGILLVLRDHPAIATMHDDLANLLTECLAQWTLAKFYNDDSAHFITAWRMARARITIIMALCEAKPQ